MSLVIDYGTDSTPQEILVELAHVLHVTVANIFQTPIVPYNCDIFEFSKRWIIARKDRMIFDDSTIFNDSYVYYLAARSLKPSSNTIFEFDDETESQYGTEDNFNSFYLFDVEYTFAQLRTVLIAATNQLIPLKGHFNNDLSLNAYIEQVLAAVHEAEPNFDIMIDDKYNDPLVVFSCMDTFAIMVQSIYKLYEETLKGLSSN